MRSYKSLLGIVCVISFGASCAFARGADEPPLQSEPYNKHHDRHFGHDHLYPDRGAIFRDVPRGSSIVNYAGLTYRFYNGIWFEPVGPAFIVVMPPIGIVVPALPAFATSFDSGGETYLYANDVYYLARPELGGYQVVNDPVDMEATPSKIGTTAGVSSAASSSVLAVGAPAVVATPAVASVSGAGAAPAVGGAATAAAGLGAPATGVAAATGAQAAAGAASTAAAVPIARTASADGLRPGAAAAPASTVPAPGAAIGPPAPRPPQTPVAAAPTYVAAPAGASSSSGTSLHMTAYPKNGQNLDQQARDQYDCYRFGVAQSGYDPMANSGVAAPGKPGQAEFDRARAACFEGRGYTLR